MVSLSRSFNTNSGGAVFFSDTINMADNEQIIESYGNFKPLKTIQIYGYNVLYTVILEIVAIVYAIKHPNSQDKCREYFIIIYLHIGLWYITLITHLISRILHKTLRIKGYFEFSKKIETFYHLPFYIVSLWNSIIMGIQALMQQFYPDNFVEKCLHNGLMSPIYYLLAFITVETFLLLYINIKYIVKVKTFNDQKAPPDVLKDCWTQCNTIENSSDLNEIGCRNVGDKFKELLEKQDEQINFLKEQNAYLGERLIILTAQNEAIHEN